MAKINVERTLERIESLPTLPTVVAQVFDTACNPEASALDLARHIAADQSLSAAVLRLVNSAYYGFNRKITTVTDAVVILGFLVVRDLALTATAFQAFPNTGSSFDRTQLWRHSLAVAMACDRIAKRMKLPPEKGYFSAGLLHDVGKVLLDVIDPDQYEAAAALAHQQDLPMWQAEIELLGIDHAQAGALFVNHWNLPGAFADAIQYHHDPANAPDDELVQAVALANYLAYQAGLGEHMEGRAPDFPERAAAFLGAEESHRQQTVEEVAEGTDRIDALLGIMDE